MNIIAFAIQSNPRQMDVSLVRTIILRMISYEHKQALIYSLHTHFSVEIFMKEQSPKYNSV